MALEPFATPVVCVRTPSGFPCIFAKVSPDYAKLTRKMGSKASSNTSNLRPKEMSAGPP